MSAQKDENLAQPGPRAECRDRDAPTQSRGSPADEETLVQEWRHCHGNLTLLEITDGTHLNVTAGGITNQVLDLPLGAAVTRPQH